MGKPRNEAQVENELNAMDQEADRIDRQRRADSAPSASAEEDDRCSICDQPMNDHTVANAIFGVHKHCLDREAVMYDQPAPAPAELPEGFNYRPCSLFDTRRFHDWRWLGWPLTAPNCEERWCDVCNLIKRPQDNKWVEVGYKTSSDLPEGFEARQKATAIVRAWIDDIDGKTESMVCPDDSALLIDRITTTLLAEPIGENM